MPPETRTSLISLCLLNRTVVIAFFPPAPPAFARRGPRDPDAPGTRPSASDAGVNNNLQPNLRGTDSRLLSSEVTIAPPLAHCLRSGHLSRRHSHTDHSHTPRRRFIRFTLPCYTANCVTVYNVYSIVRVAHRRSVPCFVLSLPSAMDASTALPRLHRVATLHTVRHGRSSDDG